MKTIKIVSLILIVGTLLALVMPFSGCRPDDPDGSGNKVNGSDVLNTNKAEYLNGEEIYVSAKGEGTAWVGLYRASDDIANSQSIRWYYVARDGFVSGQTYAFKKITHVNESRQALRNVPQGKYVLVLFSDESSKTRLSTVKFSVAAEKLSLPSAPQKMEYVPSNSASGLADGKLTVTFGEKHCAEEMVLYWANDSGILPDYTSLAPVIVKHDSFSVEMYKNTVIPPEATKIVAFGKNSMGISESFCEARLPQGCNYDFSGKVLSEFQAVSDIHITVDYTHIANTAYDQQKLHDEHLLAMCGDIAKISPNSSGIFVVGDIANSGRLSEWKHAQELFASAQGIPNVYYSVGNHDLYGNETYEYLISNFKQYANTSSVYYEKVIGGYHHVFLGSQSKSNGLDADLLDDQLNWFDSLLEGLTATEPDKPVFVYLHQSLYDTIAGSFEGQGWDGVVQDARFREIVKKYPQICMFNGHSHWDMNTYGSMHDRFDGLPNIFNTASVAYLWSSMYVPTGEYLLGSQGYYVKVYADKVLVLGRDFLSGKWIPSACFEARI